VEEIAWPNGILATLGWWCAATCFSWSFEAYHLDTSTEPAKWVKVERLEKWAIFISSDLRVDALSCMIPVRWARRSNCVYFNDTVSGHLANNRVGQATASR
jgi:hypothetical protein